MSVSFQAQSKPSRKAIWCLKVFLTEDVWHNDPGVKHRHKRNLPKKLPSTYFLDCFLHFPLGWRSGRWTGIFQFEVLYLFVALKFYYIIRKVAVPLKKWIDTNSHKWKDQKPRGKIFGKKFTGPLLSKSYPFSKVLPNPWLLGGHYSEALNIVPCPHLILILENTCICTSHSGLYHLCISDSSQLAAMDCYLSFCVC